jgi:hypothetical protein
VAPAYRVWQKRLQPYLPVRSGENYFNDNLLNAWKNVAQYIGMCAGSSSIYNLMFLFYIFLTGRDKAVEVDWSSKAPGKLLLVDLINVI